MWGERVVYICALSSSVRHFRTLFDITPNFVGCKKVQTHSSGLVLPHSIGLGSLQALVHSHPQEVDISVRVVIRLRRRM